MAEDAQADASLPYGAVWELSEQELRQAGITAADIAGRLALKRKQAKRHYEFRLETVLLALGVRTEPSHEYLYKEPHSQRFHNNEEFTSRRYG